MTDHRCKWTVSFYRPRALLRENWFLVASRTFNNSNSNEDWDNEAPRNSTRQWSEVPARFSQSSFDRNEAPPPRVFQESTRSSSNFNRCSDDHLGQGLSRDYVVKSSDVPRLIGKAGATIKDLQRENNVQIQVSNDRESLWVPVTIRGSNDQVIDQTFRQIQSRVVDIKDRETLSQPSKSSFDNTSSVVDVDCF